MACLPMALRPLPTAVTHHHSRLQQNAKTYIYAFSPSSPSGCSLSPSRCILVRCARDRAGNDDMTNDDDDGPEDRSSSRGSNGDDRSESSDSGRRRKFGSGGRSFDSGADDRNNYPDPYESLFKSKVMRSEVVVKEFDEIVSNMMSLSRMASKFPDFDLEGKKMYLQQMEESIGRYEVFMKRLELSDDEHSKEYLRYTNGQMLNGGFTLQTMFLGVKQSLLDYRNWVAQEERASADPLLHQQFRQWFKSQWSQSSLGRINMDALGGLGSRNPQILMEAQRDPQFFKAIKEISDRPSPEVMAKWLDHPTIGPLVKEMMDSMGM